MLIRFCDSEEVIKEVDPAVIAAVQALGTDSIKSQFYKIKNIGVEKLLTGEKGTVIVIQKDAFFDQHVNPINENVEVELKEIQTIDEFVKARISTLASGNLLSTDVTYYKIRKHGRIILINLNCKLI